VKKFGVFPPEYKKGESEMFETKVLTLAEADTALDEIDRRKSQLSIALAQTGAKLADAEASLGDAVLTGDENAVREVADLRLRVDGLNAALATLEKRRVAAALDQRRATADDLRRKAAEKRAELELLNGKTARLLAKLGELEGIEYGHHVLCAQRTPGGWQPQVTAGVSEMDYCDPTEVLHMGIAYPGPYQRTRSRKLLQEAVRLEHQAQVIEDQLRPLPEPQNGSDPAFAELNSTPELTR
jgi:hypothetical protein